MLRTTNTFTLLMLIAILGILSSTVQAAWIEDFESYADGELTSAPWDEGTPGPLNIVTSDAGFTGKGLVGDGLKHIWRAADPGANMITARLYSVAGYNFSRYYVGFHTEASQADGYPNSDSVIIYLSSHSGGPYISFESYDYDDGVFVSAYSPWAGQTEGILENTWYDVRMTLNNDDTVSGEYKLTTSDTWLPIGSGVVDIMDPENFAPNYVGLSGQNFGRIDDICVNGVPEPGSAVLILAGLVLLGTCGRRKR